VKVPGTTVPVAVCVAGVPVPPTSSFPPVASVADEAGPAPCIGGAKLAPAPCAGAWGPLGPGGAKATCADAWPANIAAMPPAAMPGTVASGDGARIGAATMAGAIGPDPVASAPAPPPWRSPGDWIFRDEVGGRRMRARWSWPQTGQKSNPAGMADPQRAHFLPPAFDSRTSNKANPQIRHPGSVGLFSVPQTGQGWRPDIVELPRDVQA
jgi:hypothetical protein